MAVTRHLLIVLLSLYHKCTGVIQVSPAVAVTQVSYTFSRDFISLLLKDGNVATDFGRTEVLLRGLRRVSRNTCVLLI